VKKKKNITIFIPSLSELTSLDLVYVFLVNGMNILGIEESPSQPLCTSLLFTDI